MALKLTLTFSGLLILMVPTTATQGCFPGFKVGSDGQSCYRAFPNESKNWDDAQAMCKALNANLASVTSQKELEFIWDYVITSASYFYWIGLYKNATNAEVNAAVDNWQWIDGTTYNTNWTIWKAGQPKSNDPFATMYLSRTSEDPYWNGESTKATKHAFICKGKTSLVPTTTAKSPSSSSTTSSGHSPEGEHDGMSSVLKLAIGLGIGLGVLFISLLGVLIYCIRPKKQQEESRYDEVHPCSPSYLTVTNQGYTKNDEYTYID